MPLPLSSLFLERMIRFLMPYFTSITPDLALVREEIAETLASYGARTRAELLNVVQIIAFSMSALDMLADAKATENLSPSMRLRFRSCANNLNRSSQQAEKALANRLACDAPEEIVERVEQENEMPDLQTEELLRRINVEIDAHRQRSTSNRLATPPQPDPNKRQKGSAMLNALFDAAPPGQSAA
jgi:hypothetical protein